MSFAISILTVGLLIALHEAGHFVAARRVGMRVLKYSIGLLNAVFSWTSPKTGTTYQLGVLPFGGFVQIKGMNPFEEGALDDPQSYQKKSTWRRGVVLIAGPLMNLFVAWALFFGLFLVGSPQPINESKIGIVVLESRAAKAGLKTGDRVVKFNGEKVNTWEDLAQKLHVHPEQKVSLEIERGKERLSIEVIPENKNGIGLIGIGQPTEIISAPLHLAAVHAGETCLHYISATMAAIGQILTGTGGAVQTAGPVGIVKMAATSLDVGLRSFLALVAYLSLMLFMFNLLPIPALDGGRVIFLLYELVTRRRINPKVDVVVNSIGFFLLIGLLAVMTLKDIFFSS